MKCYLLTYKDGHKTCLVINDNDMSVCSAISSLNNKFRNDNDLVQITQLNCDTIKLV